MDVGFYIPNRRTRSSATAIPTSGLLWGVKPRRATTIHHRRNRAYREPSSELLMAKRAIDIGGASLGLLLFAPLLIGIAIAIKATSPGPVFFRQKRYGYRN